MFELSSEAILTLLTLVGAVWLFATEKLPLDVVALAILAILLIGGVVTVQEAFAGFSSPATITVATMFVLSAGLVQSGALGRISTALGNIRGENRFTLVLMLAIAALSAFVNNTAAVAIFLPMVLSACSKNGTSPSQVLIPMSYAAQIGGVCTVIGTSTNLLVDGLVRNLGYTGFGVFDFLGLGLAMGAIGFAYLLSVRRFVLPNHAPESIADHYTLRSYLTELRVVPQAQVIGKTLADLELNSNHGITVLELLRGDERHWAPHKTKLREADVLLVRGDVNAIRLVEASLGLAINSEFKLSDQLKNEKDTPVLLEVVVAPYAHFQGQSLAQAQFQWRFNSIVLALERRGEILREKLNTVAIKTGDVLLLLCPKNELPALRANPNFIALGEQPQQKAPKYHAWLATAILVLVIGTAAMGYLPIVASAIVGAAMLVALRVLQSEQAYQAIDWRVIILLAGILPLGVAMQKTGLADLVAQQITNLVGTQNPWMMLSAIYLLTALLTELMSNNATAVLVIPIAASSAAASGLDPTPFFVAVMFAASTSFATPVGYQTNTMVMGPGRYRFTDYLKIGVPLNLLLWMAASVLIPTFFPFKTL